MYASAEYLRRAAASPAILALKVKSYGLMQVPVGARVIDVGCGPGIDTCAIAEIVGTRGEVVGVDADEHMVAAANLEAERRGVARWTRHVKGHFASLAFANDYFDACRSERMFQHLPPASLPVGLAEFARVTKPGGRIVAIDTDWATLSIDSMNPQIERRLAWVNANRFPNGYAGRQLYREMKDAGLGDLLVEHAVIQLDAAGLAFHLSAAGEIAVATGVITADQSQCWWSDVASSSARGTTFAQLTIVTVSGINSAHARQG